MNNWRGILLIDEIFKISDGKITWSKKNLKNILHSDGEEFILKTIFTQEIEIPEFYYFGLDSRASIASDDTMTTILDEEPSDFAYERVPVVSSNQFSVTQVSGTYRATGPVLTFRAVGGSWGPVKNLFLTNDSEFDGKLIASVNLEEEVTVNDGESINVRMALALKNC